MPVKHNEGYDSPSVSGLFQQQTPMLNRKQNNERTTNKRPGSNISPPGQQQLQSDVPQQLNLSQLFMNHTSSNSKLSFPPIVVYFKGEQQTSIKEITDDLISKWKNQHGMELFLRARFGHMHSLLIFADDSSTFESLLDPNRWPKTLNEVNIEVKVPRQLPPEYSIVIQQFHRNWNENEWLEEMQQRYVSLYKITRMRVKDGSPLNAVRADFRSIEEVKMLIRSGKINIGSMVHPVKSYHLPIRINKCLKCLRHDHTTKSCTKARLCPKCATEHSLENGCENRERCINCEGNHISGHSACPIVQEKRQALVEQSKKQRAELLIRAEQQQHNHVHQRGDYPALNDNMMHLPSHMPRQSADSTQKVCAQTLINQNEQGPQKNIEYTLSSFLDKMDRRLDEFSSRLSSQLCEIEKKINVYSDRHLELEPVIDELVLPAIQELGNILSQSFKSRASLEAFKKFNEKISGIMSNRRPHSNIDDKQSTDNHSTRPATNVS
jgi:hypothetical protein